MYFAVSVPQYSSSMTKAGVAHNGSISSPQVMADGAGRPHQPCLVCS